MRPAVSGFELDRTESKKHFPYFLPVQTRWNDLDAYRHVNNARYHGFFDTVIMHYLVYEGGFDVLNGPIVPFTVENMCRFYRSIDFPMVVDCGLRVAKLGASSVRYELGLFSGDSPEVIATGYFVDVFVDHVTQRPTPLPDDIRAHLARIVVGGS